MILLHIINRIHVKVQRPAPNDVHLLLHSVQDFECVVTSKLAVQLALASHVRASASLESIARSTDTIVTTF